MHAFLSTNFCLNDILNIWTVHRWGQCCCSIVGPSYTEKNTCQSRHNLLCFRFTSSFARFFSFSLSWLLGFGSNGVLVAVHLALLNALAFSVRKVNKKSVLFRTFFRHWNELALCYINSNHTSPRAKIQKNHTKEFNQVFCFLYFQIIDIGRKQKRRWQLKWIASKNQDETHSHSFIHSLTHSFTHILTHSSAYTCTLVHNKSILETTARKYAHPVQQTSADARALTHTQHRTNKFIKMKRNKVWISFASDKIFGR